MLVEIGKGRNPAILPGPLVLPVLTNGQLCQSSVLIKKETVNYVQHS